MGSNANRAGEALVILVSALTSSLLCVSYSAPASQCVMPRASAESLQSCCIPLSCSGSGRHWRSRPMRLALCKGNGLIDVSSPRRKPARDPVTILGQYTIRDDEGSLGVIVDHDTPACALCGGVIPSRSSLLIGWLTVCSR